MGLKLKKKSNFKVSFFKKGSLERFFYIDVIGGLSICSRLLSRHQIALFISLLHVPFFFLSAFVIIYDMSNVQDLTNASQDLNII